MVREMNRGLDLTPLSPPVVPSVPNALRLRIALSSVVVVREYQPLFVTSSSSRKLRRDDREGGSRSTPPMRGRVTGAEARGEAPVRRQMAPVRSNGVKLKGGVKVSDAG